MTVQAYLGKRLKQFREERSMKQGEFGELLGVLASTICKQEKGRGISILHLIQYNEALNIHMYDWWKDWDNRDKS